MFSLAKFLERRNQSKHDYIRQNRIKTLDELKEYIKYQGLFIKPVEVIEWEVAIEEVYPPLSPVLPVPTTVQELVSKEENKEVTREVVAEVKKNKKSVKTE